MHRNEKENQAPINIIKYIMPIFLLAHTGNLFAQKKPTYSKEILRRIDSVENNLISWVKFNHNTNILQRMKDMNVNGVVVAVINNYNIEWVKAYGYADT